MEVGEVLRDLLDDIARAEASPLRRARGAARTSAAQSRMAQSRGLGERVDERRPAAALRGQHAFALGGQPIAAASALAGLLHPAAAESSRDPRA